MDWVVYRPGDGIWYIAYNAGGYNGAYWGVSIDIPTAADYDGDGKTDPAVYRPTDGGWWYLKSSTSYTTSGAIAWGNIGDQPVVGDFDGDSKADFTVFRPSNGKWHTYTSQNNYQGADLGVAGDTVIPSSYLKQTGSSIASDLINKERLKPTNAVGGTDLYSQNFSWGRNLVSLPGRSGMDLNLGVSYNSLVWTRVGTSMLFDPDDGYDLGPGFKLGFPTIEPAYYNGDTGKWNYLMVAPSGAKVEFRQMAGAANVYETYDSSYARLTTSGASNPNDPVEAIILTVVTTDGTQMYYAWKGGAFHCTQIKDRNGNYLTLGYDAYDLGLLTSVTDTLGRILYINYDANWNLTSITQTWKDNNGSGSNVSHTYATFSYTTKTIAHDFDDSLNVWDLINGMNLKVLDKITYADGSFTKFYYNGYAQVYKVEEHAADSGGTAHILNYVRTNLESPSTDQTDCPRFTQTATKVENFNLSGGAGTEQELVVTNTVPTSDSETFPGSLSVSGKYVDVGLTGHPDGLYSRTWFGGSGVYEGQVLATQDCTGADCATVKRWTWNSWQQDDPYASIAVNPRVKETRVGDGTNTKRTTIKYLDVTAMNPVATYGLVEEVNVYAADLSTVLKKSTVSYNLSSHLTDLRIIGLPAETSSWGWNDIGSRLELVSKVTYLYDEGDFSDSGLQQTISPTQHDSTNYGSSFSYRGNLTSAKRWDVSQPSEGAAAITTAIKYNTAGSVVAKITPWDGTNTRTIRIGYADNFNSSPGVSTYAYPTVLTDPAGTSLGASGHSSTVKYRYDIGANVEATSPAPAGQTYGKTSKRIFDSIGRLQRNSVYVNTTEHSYVRYEYPTNGIQSKTYAPIVDQDGDGNIAEDEVYSESWHDGAGRVRMSRTEHPGSTGGWASTFVEYDILGRVKRQSVPTETNSSYTPAGDDSAGPLWTYLKYDWMGRVVRKINTDGIDETTLNDSDVLISYEGCGCAGGLVTTVEGELVPRTDTTGNARRKQKSYADILGRTFKTETYEWDGTTVYSTVLQSFDGADRPVRTRQFAGDTSSTIYQDTTASFDGHGRLATSHRPEQRDSSNNLKYTTYTYNPDDSIQSVTDGRGAATHFEYNSRGFVTEKSWSVPGGSGITDPADVTFSYDNLGNRTAMTDGMGTMAYTYDSLSRLTSETRDFTDTLANEPNNGLFTLSYEYTLTGLKSYTDPYGEQIEYEHQKNGRLDAVTGDSFAGITTYANNPTYRAWGALKHLEYGSGRQMEITYNDLLKPESSEVNTISSPATKTLDRDYEYTADGRLRFVNDALGGSSERFDRLFTYDHAGRVKDAKTGIEAQGQTQSNLQLLPYRQNYTFNTFGNITARTSTLWDYDGNWNFTYNVTNNRASGSLYDHDGRETRDSVLIHFQYDASGAMRKTWRNYSTYTVYETLLDHDGHGRESKRSQRTWDPDLSQWEPWTTTYFISSSVLGRVVTEVGDSGKKKRTYVIAAGSVLAKQAVDSSGQEGIGWKYSDASGLSTRSSSTGTYAQAFEAEELDALGNNVGTFAVPTPPDRPGNSASSGTGFTFASTDWSDCELDGIMTPCSMVDRAMGMGAVQAQTLFYSEQRGLRYHSFDPVELPGRRYQFFLPDRITSTQTDNGTVGGTVNDEVGYSTQEIVYPGGQGQWLTVGGISLFGDRTPCADMARRAQEIADRKIREAGTDIVMGSTDSINNAWDSVLKAFDAEFTPMYIGQVVDGIGAAYSLMKSQGGVKSPPMSQYGQQDFQEKFLDSEYGRYDTDLMADQVHHFAAFLSMGIHRVNFPAATHAAEDQWNRNYGDVALSWASYGLGKDLRTQPRLLRSIGRTIRSSFCMPVARGAGGRIG